MGKPRIFCAVYTGAARRHLACSATRPRTPRATGDLWDGTLTVGQSSFSSLDFRPSAPAPARPPARLRDRLHLSLPARPRCPLGHRALSRSTHQPAARHTVSFNHKTRASAPRDTYGQRCDRILFFSNITDPSFPR
jgi:hypothetical protein